MFNFTVVGIFCVILWHICYQTIIYFILALITGLLTFGICICLLLVVYNGTLSDNKLAMTVDLFEYEPIRLNYTFYGEEKPQLECFDTKGQ